MAANENKLTSAQRNILRAAKNGNAIQVALLAAMDRDLLAVRDADGSTLLHCAAWKGHLEVVELLLRLGCDVNAANANDHRGTTALHAAAHANHRAIAQILIDHGADINATNMHGRTPLDETAFHNASAVRKLLQEPNRSALNDKEI